MQRVQFAPTHVVGCGSSETAVSPRPGAAMGKDWFGGVAVGEQKLPVIRPRRAGRACARSDATCILTCKGKAWLMNRRHFFQTTACLAASLAPAAGQAPAPRRPRIGFLGVAHSHAGGKVKAVVESGDWELVGVLAENEKLADTHRRAGHRIVTQEELLREAEVIAVESAVRDHFPHARAALVAGKHVHVEKPPAVTLDEFRELQGIARAQKRIMQMGYMWRYHPGFDRIIEAARAGWLGEIQVVRASMDSFITDAGTRRELAEFRGGGMFELGCHLTDALVRLLGRPQRISPTLASHAAAQDGLADNTVAVFEYPRALAVIMINLQHPGAGPGRFFEVVGTNGTATLRPIEPPALSLDLAKPAGPYKKGAQAVALPRYQRYVPEFADLADAVRSNRPLAVTPETDLIVQECVLKACGMA
jgi:predicted dehydrogenase